MTDRVDRRSASTEQSTAAPARAAQAVERGASGLIEYADRRTELAGDRTLLAAERTYAAWVRTGLAALASGVGARALFQDLVPELLAKLTATVLIAFAAICIVIAVWRQLRDAVPPPQTDLRPVPHWLLIVMNAFLLLVAFAALIAVWLA